MSRIVAKLKKHVAPPAAGDLDRWITAHAGVGWEGKILAVSRLFDDAEVDLDLLCGRALERDGVLRREGIRLDHYLALDVQRGVDSERLACELLLHGHASVAYVEKGKSFTSRFPAQLSSFGGLLMELDQSHLEEAPRGVAARYAWTFPGGDGVGVRFLDIERGWNFTHADLIDAGMTQLQGTNAYGDDRVHGTAVLGIVAAVDNGKDVTGVAPGVASVRAVSIQRSKDEKENIARAILRGVADLRFGDVLLVEHEVSSEAVSLRPVEVEEAVFEAIRFSAALGVTVIEPVGNGGGVYRGQETGDLDRVRISSCEGRYRSLNRSDPDFRDSGAILVGSSDKARLRLGSSNFGNRVDCYSRGDGISTSGAPPLLANRSGDLADSRSWGGVLASQPSARLEDPPVLASGVIRFPGTSAAAAIIAGAAVCVQSLAQVHLGFRYSPWQLRLLLSDPANGTPSSDEKSFAIGRQPDLAQIIDNVLAVSGKRRWKPAMGIGREPRVEPEDSLLAPGAVDTSPAVLLLPFTVRALVEPRALRFEVISFLPRTPDRKVSVWLEMPPHLADLRGIWREPLEAFKLAAENVLVPVNPCGQHYFREALFPSAVPARLQLVVELPGDLRTEPCQITVRLLEGWTELSRITWNLGAT